MKHYILSMGLVLIAFCLLTCKEDESATTPGEFQIQVDELIQEDGSGGRTKATLPSGSSLLISIEDAAGNVVLNFERVSIITFSGSSVSAPILLKPGNYKLKDFLVVNESDEVLYAIPKSGSEFARLVNRPLPFTFTVWKDRVNNISTQVVRATESSPEKFGYVAFNINEAAYPEFRVAVFVPHNGQMLLTQTKAFLIHGGDTIYSKLLSSSINEIIFKGTPEGIYTLILIKSGYGKYTRTFTLQDLKAELDGEPLEVFLNPALTFESSTFGSEFPETQHVSFDINGDAGKEVVVDWDDGTFTTLILKPLPGEPPYYDGITGSFTLDHVYTTTTHPVPRHVSITGDIESIRQLNFGYSVYIKSLSLQNLTGLIDARVWFQNSLETVDFSSNKNLQMIGVGYNESMKSFTIPQTNKLKFLILEEMDLTTEEIDKVINDLYQNVTAHNIMEGEFRLSKIAEDGSSYEYIGPPSEDGLAKLDILANYYLWNVN